MRLLATQAQLLEKLTSAKVQDPISAALTSGAASDSASGSSTGTRGIAAREAFLKTFEHHAELEGIAKRAQQELGLSSQEPGMMRQYVEQGPSEGPQNGPDLRLLPGPPVGGLLSARRRVGRSLAARGLVMAEQIGAHATGLP